MVGRKVIAMYVRLSEEDRNVDGIIKSESDSIANQRKLLSSFISNRAEFDDYEVREYCDDGHTGTDFKRDGFVTMMNDVRSGLISCILVKDFSRFGRDYLEVGNYLEFILPSLQVRFISINDNYDSDKNVGMTGGMNVAIKNLIYNMYSTDMSKKTKSALVTKHKSGKCVSPFAKFGYKKSEDDKSKLVIDEEAAAIVRKIFQLALEGNTVTAIAKILNKEGVMTVGEYKERHSAFRMGTYNKKRMWESSSVRDIIHDELYIGNMVWNRTSHSIANGKKKIKNPRSEWKVTPNTHEPIVSKEVFDRVQELCPLNYRGWKGGRNNGTSIFICSECGRALIKNTNKQMYQCRTNSMDLPDCCTTEVPVDDLESSLLDYVRLMSSTFVGKKASKKAVNDGKQELLEGIESAKKMQKKLSTKKMDYYASYRDGKISRDEFMKVSDGIKRDIEDYDRRISDMTLEYDSLCKTVSNEAEEAFIEIEALKSFDKELLSKVIDKVIVYGPEEIEVIWKSDDIFKMQYAQYIIGQSADTKAMRIQRSCGFNYFLLENKFFFVPYLTHSNFY